MLCRALSFTAWSFNSSHKRLSTHTQRWGGGHEHEWQQPDSQQHSESTTNNNRQASRLKGDESMRRFNVNIFKGMYPWIPVYNNWPRNALNGSLFVAESYW